MSIYGKLKRLRRATRFRGHAKRQGFTITELLVAATLLVAMMSVVAPLAVRSSRLWQDSRYYRLAVEELTNQLDRLTSLDTANRTTAIAELTPSPQIAAVLPNPVLTAETIVDADGTRLVLYLAWDRLGEDTPVTLVGWVDPLPSTLNALQEGADP